MPVDVFLLMEIITKGNHTKDNLRIEQQRPINGASTATHDDLQSTPDDKGQNSPELPEKQTLVEVCSSCRVARLENSVEVVITDPGTVLGPIQTLDGTHLFTEAGAS